MRLHYISVFWDNFSENKSIDFCVSNIVPLEYVIIRIVEFLSIFCAIETVAQN